MSIDIATIDPEVAADAEAIMAAVAAGKTVDPRIVRRVRARSQATRERILRDHGLLDIAVPAIRELRDT